MTTSTLGRNDVKKMKQFYSLQAKGEQNYPERMVYLHFAYSVGMTPDCHCGTLGNPGAWFIFKQRRLHRSITCLSRASGNASTTAKATVVEALLRPTAVRQELAAHNRAKLHS